MKTLIQKLILFPVLLFSPFVFAQQFTEEPNINLNVSKGDACWGDYNNDGYLDFITSGSLKTKIYKNNGDSTFSEQSEVSIIGLQRCSVEWGDYDNDSDLDILMSGDPYYSKLTTKIYKNNGDNSFSELLNTPFIGVADATVNWGDYDNDGDLDFLLTGSTGTERISKIYKNNGDDTFTEQTDISLIGVSNGSAAWGDYDNDGNLDILLTGYSILGRISKIYKNNGNNSFEEQKDILLTGVYESSVAWGDYDNDGDLDILLTGNTNNPPIIIAKIYKNNGNNLFVEQTDISLLGLRNGQSLWGDYDNDGNLDILLTGENSSNSYTRIYKNNDDNTFSEQVNISLIGITGKGVKWGDYDNDGDLDILLSGYPNSKIYKNNIIIKNTKPTNPINLKHSIDGKIVSFFWDASTDLETTGKGLSYNLAIYRKQNHNSIFSPMSINNGYRCIVKMGNTNHNTFWRIKDIKPGNYYWSVQGIDNTFEGSDFAVADTFMTSLYFFNRETDKNITCGDAIQLVDSVINKWDSVKIKYTWSPTFGINDPNIYNPIASPNRTTTYIVTASDGTFSGVDTVIVNVTPTPFVRIPQICIITTDVKTGKNLIVWKKEEYIDGCIKIAGYYILRKKSLTKWDTLTYKPFNSSGSFVDTTSTPELRTYDYVIVAKDSLGRLSPPSSVHTPLLLQYGGLTGDLLALNWTTYKIDNKDFLYENYILYSSSRKDTLVEIYNDILYDKTSINVKTDLKKKVYYRLGGIMTTGCYIDSVFVSNLKKKGVLPIEFKGVSYSNIEDNKIDESVFLEDIDQNSFVVFPNPTNDRLIVNLKEYTPNTFIVITDINGKFISKQQAYLYNSIDINGLDNGVYLLKLINSNGSINKKFIKM